MLSFLTVIIFYSKYLFFSEWKHIYYQNFNFFGHPIKQLLDKILKVGITIGYRDHNW
jgi:hypothetical protein